jgi:hypothetical protein
MNLVLSVQEEQISVQEEQISEQEEQISVQEEQISALVVDSDHLIQNACNMTGGCPQRNKLQHFQGALIREATGCCNKVEQFTGLQCKISSFFTFQKIKFSNQKRKKRKGTRKRTQFHASVYQLANDSTSSTVLNATRLPVKLCTTSFQGQDTCFRPFYGHHHVSKFSYGGHCCYIIVA